MRDAPGLAGKADQVSMTARTAARLTRRNACHPLAAGHQALNGAAQVWAAALISGASNSPVITAILSAPAWAT